MGPSLLRIDISDVCNYSCSFCCWENPSTDENRVVVLPMNYYKTLAKALVASGCSDAHLTGGEPLALERGTLCAIVQIFTEQQGIDEFYVTSNGSLLDEEYCRLLSSTFAIFEQLCRVAQIVQ